MTTRSESTIRHRQSKLDSGWLRVDALIPPVSAYKALAMIEAGVASSVPHAVALALESFPIENP